MIYPLTKHVLSVRARDKAEIKVYRVEHDSHNPATFYFCCEADGACGRHRPSIEAANAEAVVHADLAHHQSSKEARHGQA